MDKIEPRVNAVFDCMVFLQAIASSNGPASECLDFVRNDMIGLFSSEEILDEVKNVLTRPKFRKQYKSLTEEMVSEFLAEIEDLAFVFVNPSDYFKLPRDPKDEKYINLAVEMDAHYLVSRDRDLLDLMTDQSENAIEFRWRFRRLKIVDPAEFLRIVREMEVAPVP